MPAVGPCFLLAGGVRANEGGVAAREGRHLNKKELLSTRRVCGGCRGLEGGAGVAGGITRLKKLTLAVACVRCALEACAGGWGERAATFDSSCSRSSASSRAAFSKKVRTLFACRLHSISCSSLLWTSARSAATRRTWPSTSRLKFRASGRSWSLSCLISSLSAATLCTHASRWHRSRGPRDDGREDGCDASPASSGSLLSHATIGVPPCSSASAAAPTSGSACPPPPISSTPPSSRGSPPIPPGTSPAAPPLSS